MCSDVEKEGNVFIVRKDIAARAELGSFHVFQQLQKGEHFCFCFSFPTVNIHFSVHPSMWPLSHPFPPPHTSVP